LYPIIVNYRAPAFLLASNSSSERTTTQFVVVFCIPSTSLELAFPS
jgi:hypothetical protein